MEAYRNIINQSAFDTWHMIVTNGSVAIIFYFDWWLNMNHPYPFNDIDKFYPTGIIVNISVRLPNYDSIFLFWDLSNIWWAPRLHTQGSHCGLTRAIAYVVWILMCTSYILGSQHAVDAPDHTNAHGCRHHANREGMYCLTNPLFTSQQEVLPLGSWTDRKDFWGGRSSLVYDVQPSLGRPA
jgi:hypothetical protein